MCYARVQIYHHVHFFHHHVQQKIDVRIAHTTTTIADRVTLPRHSLGAAGPLPRSLLP
jgi:hypothetical protein